MNLLSLTSSTSWMDGIFSHLADLTSYFGCKIMHFIDDLAFKDFSGLRILPPISSLSSQVDTSSRFQTLSNKKCSKKRRFTVQRSTLAPCSLRQIWKALHGYFGTLSQYTCRFGNQLLGFWTSLRTTLRGSSEDIGWLQRVEGSPPVEDGTVRFHELLHGIRRGDHHLPSCFVYLLVPGCLLPTLFILPKFQEFQSNKEKPVYSAGLFSNLSPLYFVNTRRFFSKMGLTCHIAKIHSEASVERNAWELKNYIEELFWGSGKKVMILGHSKGGVDSAAALSMYWPELKPMVSGLAVVQCPYGGSPIASDVLRPGQVAEHEARRIMEFIVCKLIKGDFRALEDLTYDRRRQFLARYELPWQQIPLVSFHTEVGAGPGMLATMSHVAHAEVPWLRNVFSGLSRVPVVVPLAAAMATSAMHLRLRYGERSDGLVVRRDAEIPGSIAIRLERKLDHAWMVYCSRRRQELSVEEDPSASEMCEALFTLVLYLGKNMDCYCRPIM
ncbi:uncharacterized protein LOC144709913 isoform X2 [Wolffia australiana]